jgi:Bacterial Ig-like domain/WD40-like Beta Propeller Repeat
VARRGPARAALLVAVAPLCALLSGCFTAPPQIIRLSPVNGSTGVAADAPLSVVFDHPVQRGSVVSRFHVDPGIGGCDLQAAFSAPTSAPCYVAWDGSSSQFTLFHGRTPFQPNQRYTLAVSPGVTDDQGVANTLDHSWNITTGPPPTVDSTSPSDGSTLVPVDAPMVVAFSNAMDASTARAISLSPGVPGTKVVRNTRDHGRFVVLPGRLLDAGVEYTLTVGTAAVDEHGQHLAATVRSVFRTGKLAPDGHAIVLARRSGEPPTEVLLTQLAPAVPGEPAAAAVVLDAPRCEASPACGGVAVGGPLVAYEQATVSPDGRWLAVVERDLRARGAAAALSLVALPSLVERHLVEDGSDVSWSPDGTRLAYQAPDGFHVQTIAAGHDVRLPAGDPLAAPAAWSGDGSELALPVQDPVTGAQHVDLVVPDVDARYPVPGLSGDAGSPALTPDGSLLAVARSGAASLAGTWTVRLRGGDPAPHRLGSDLTPLAFVDNGTLLAAERPADGDPGLVRVSIADGGRDRLANQPLASDLSGATVTPSGRQVAYLLPDSSGARQAAIENVDGSNPAFLTTFPVGGVEAYAVEFSS